jgi:translation initiation factor 2 subunit 2
MEYDYQKLLEKAKRALPETNKEASRFEIPVADVVTGKQTVIKNFLEISKALRRDETHLAKYLYKELAVPGSMRGPELLLQGKINSGMINQRIREYAAEFVICNECGKPDTDMNKTDRLFFLKCQACGARRSLRAI